MAILRNLTPAQKAAYVVLGLAVVIASVWFVVYTPLGRLLWD